MFILPFILFQNIIYNTLAGSTSNFVYSSSCANESVSPRICPYTNYTQYLLNIKKGGTSILSSNPYDQKFFLCQQYNFDCGYVENQFSTIQISNGIQLSMSAADLDAILPSNLTLSNMIKPYLGLTGQQASCGMTIHPLVLSSNQSTLFFNNYMTNLTTKVSAQYTSQRTANSSAYTDLNINTKTSVLQTVKNNPTWTDNSSQYWNYFISNQFTNMSDYLKEQYDQRDQLYLLHSAYLLDSVSAQCNRYQSVNFLVDQSGSITASKFALAIQFLQQYVNQTKDEPTLMSINFYSTAFQQYINYGNSKASILSMLKAKTYPAGGTLTGSAINKTVLFIKGSSLPTGLPRVLIILTDGGSYDDVIAASNYARNNGISIIAVGIGANVNQAQLLQIAQSPSNMILISNYSELKRLVDYISNYMCKQTVTIHINETLQNNHLKVPSSPNYYRIQKDLTNHLMLNINYQTDPKLSQEQIYQSQIDPFPDSYTEYTNIAYSSSALKKTYFIQPQSQINILEKKNMYDITNAQSSYISIGANQLIFNISLSACATSNCAAQKLAAGIPISSTSHVGFGIDRISTDTKGQNNNNEISSFKNQQDKNKLQNFEYFKIGFLLILVCILSVMVFLVVRNCLKQQQNNKIEVVQQTVTLQNIPENSMKQEQYFGQKENNILGKTQMNQQKIEVNDVINY